MGGRGGGTKSKIMFEKIWQRRPPSLNWLINYDLINVDEIRIISKQFQIWQHRPPFLNWLINYDLIIFK